MRERPFSGRIEIGQRKYRDYMEEAIGAELKNPLGGVFASEVMDLLTR